MPIRRLTDGLWLVDFYPAGRASGRVRRRFRGTRKAAEKAVRQAQAEADRRRWGLGPSRRPCFEALVGDFLEAKRAAGRALSTLATLRRVLVGLSTRWGRGDPAGISREQVQAWLAEREASGAKAATRRLEFGALRSLYRWAAECGILDATPFRGIELPNVPARAPQWLTPGEFRALWEGGAQDARDAAEVLVSTGLRVGDAACLTPSLVRGGSLVVPVRKTGRWLSLPCPPELASLVDRFAGRWTHCGLRRRIADLAARAGLDCSPHVLRHTHASWLVSAGYPVYSVRDRLGHASVRTTQVYAHLARLDWRVEAPRLPEATRAVLGDLCPGAFFSSESS